MSTRFEWAHAGSERPEVISADEVEEVAPDGNDNRDWGIAAGGVMIYGSPQELYQWLTAALDDLTPALRKARNKAIKDRRASMGDGKCKHDFMLTEDGYSRSWSTRIDKPNKIITATFDGSSDFSEDGDGVYLECLTCGHVKDVPADWTVDYV